MTILRRHSIALETKAAPISQKTNQPLSHAILGVAVITVINLCELCQSFYNPCFALCVAGTVAAASLSTGPPKPRIIVVSSHPFRRCVLILSLKIASYILTVAHPIVWALSAGRRRYRKNDQDGEEEGARLTRLIDEDEEAEVDFYGSVVNPRSTIP